MAVGLPLKTTYANGDVYSASDVNDTNGTINLLQTSTLSRQAGKNAVINGAMEVAQYGTSTALASNAKGYSPDRWKAAAFGSACVVSRQATSDTTNLPTIQYCVRMQRNSGQTGTNIIYVAQSLESINSIPFAGQAVTFSFYARRGANYSPTSNVLGAFLYSGTGTDQNWIDVAYTGQATVASGNATLTTTWQRFTYTGTVSASATELAVVFGATPTGTAGAADYFEVTGVQVELGSYATTFSRAGGTIQGELAACQRYYWRSTGGSAYGPYGMGYGMTTTTAYFAVQLPVTMRTNPSTLDYSTLAVGLYGVSSLSITALALSQTNPLSIGLSATVAAGLTANRPYQIENANSASAYLGVSAEL